MKCADANVTYFKFLLTQLEEKRLGQLKAFYIMKVDLYEGSFSNNFENSIKYAQNICLTPIWSWYLNNQLKTNFELTIDNSLPAYTDTGNNDIKSLIKMLLGWEDYNEIFQSSCPLGYTISILKGEIRNNWEAILLKAFQIIKETIPTLYSEMLLLLKAVIPLVASEGVHSAFSFSAENRLGAIFLTYSNDSRVVIDNLIHEYYHNRLNLLFTNDDILINNEEEEYYSLWRKTARPLKGILHGTFASYGIAEFWYRYILQNTEEYSADEKKSIVKGLIKMSVATKLGIKTIEKYGNATTFGVAFIDELKDKSELIFDWACSTNSLLVGEYYRSYNVDFEAWKVKYNIRDIFFENIF